MNDTTGDEYGLEFSAADGEGAVAPQASQPANPTFRQAFQQSPKRQAALAKAAQHIKTRKDRQAPQVNFPSVSVKDSRENLRRRKVQVEAAMAHMRQHHREIEKQRTENRMQHDLNRTAINARIKNARSEVLGEIAQNRQNAVQQHAQKQKTLNAQHATKQSGVGWFDSPGAPFRKIGMFFGHLGKKLGAWGGHKATMGKYALMSRPPIRAVLTSARRWQYRGQRSQMKKDFKTQDRVARDTVKIEKKGSNKLRKIALRHARADHKAVKGDHREANRPLRRHKAEQRADWLKAKGQQVKAFGHGVSAGVGQVTKNTFTRRPKGPSV
jgi:hypothetical protein